MSGINPDTGQPTGYYTKIGKNPIKKSPELNTKQKIQNVFYEPDGVRLGIKPIPVGILILGLYFAYKKFSK